MDSSSHRKSTTNFGSCSLLSIFVLTALVAIVIGLHQYSETLISVEKAMAVENGMTMEEVEEHLGAPISAELSGTSIVWYFDVFGKGDQFWVAFEDGKVDAIGF